MTADSIEDVLGGGEDADFSLGTGDLTAAQYAPFSFTAKRLVLSALSDKAVSVVPNRDVMPVLKFFLVQVAPGSLRMAATDLELSVLASTPAVSTEATETIVLPARRLLAILREAASDDITVDVDGELATVRAGSAKWDLQLADCGEYPPLPDPAEVEMHPVGREAFLGALRAVRHAVGSDSGRPPLQQVDIRVGDDGVAAVTACDGTRLARATLDGFPLSMQVPAGALESLVKTLESSEMDQVHVGETNPEHGVGHLIFRVSETVFLASKMQAKFPDVEKLLLRPALENKLLLEVDKGELAGAVRRVRINADPDTSAIGLLLAPGMLTVTSRDKYGNRAEEAISAIWEAPERLAVVNHQFLSAMLAAHPALTCRFWLGPEAGKKRSVLLLRDEDSGMVGVIYQMLASQVGYGDG